MTDFWQGQRPWFALDSLGGPDARDGERSQDDSTRLRRRATSIEQRPHRERPEEFVQRSIQRTYDR